MEAFTVLRSIALPLDRANVDTDAIIPKQFLKSISRTGFGENLFDEWRYLDRGVPGIDPTTRPRNSDFPLNQPRYAGAQVLLTRENFGCGSSREHAVWALHDFGIRAVLAPSFAEIFHGNCFKNGLLPVRLAAPVVDRLFELTKREEGLILNIDLAAETVVLPSAETLRFDVDPARKQRLLRGIDDIAATLQRAADIRAYETDRRIREPWLFA
jgi:3-isopropylmalate/(R)-2-methylmalate dehydratase small subunit